MRTHELTCPLGHTCDKCLWNIHMTGMNPHTGAAIDEWKCAIAWLPLLASQQTQQILQTAASVDRVHDVFAEAMNQSLEAPPEPRLIQQ